MTVEPSWRYEGSAPLDDGRLPVFDDTGVEIGEWVPDTRLQAIADAPTVDLCKYHYRQKKRKGMAHCEAVWTENAEYPNGECVVVEYLLVERDALAQGGQR